MNIWVIMILAGIFTYLIRSSFIQLFSHLLIPPRLKSALQYVPAAVLSAIIFPELLMPGGTLDLTLDNSRLVAGVLALIVAWKTRSVVWTILSGMLALLLLQLLV
ncbi:MAG: AzlD domain-containing protein [Anaerolineales bacterium]|jgi:branched-subunit amino acid transport protein